MGDSPVTVMVSWTVATFIVNGQVEIRSDRDGEILAHDLAEARELRGHL